MKNLLHKLKTVLLSKLFAIVIVIISAMCTIVSVVMLNADFSIYRLIMTAVWFILTAIWISWIGEIKE